jgi:gliding motility-associated-like protein
MVNFYAYRSLTGAVLLLLLFFSTAFSQTTVNFNFTGAAQTWVVPPCVYSINVTLAGAKGGGPNGGNGAVITGTLAVTPGQTLTIYVGGMGTLGNASGGWNGGGTGRSSSNGSWVSGGGGGATDIRIGGVALANRVAVAGAGGGRSGGSDLNPGGAANCPNGAVGGASFGSGGGGGTQSGGGSGAGWGGGTPGVTGSLGTGGAGGQDNCYNVAPGGGGGGGYYGGGGGGADCWPSTPHGGGGGGGGSSLLPGGWTCTPNTNNSHGYAIISYAPSTGTIVTGNTGPFCVGETIQLTSEAGAISYSWTGPNGFTSSLQNPTLPNGTSLQAGTYNLTAVLSDCEVIGSTNVVINEPVQPVFTPINPICQDASAPALVLVSNNAINGTWNPSNVQTNTPGMHQYTFTPNTGECATSANMQIEIIANELPVFTQIQPICEGQPAPVLPGTSTNGFTGSWSPPTISTAVPGTSSYTFNPTSGQCATQGNMNVTILANTQSETSVSNCVSYTWNGQTYSSSGTYSYLTANANGCDSTAILNLTIINALESFTNVTSCDSYSWNGQNYTASGSYSYLTTSAQGCDSTAHLNLIITNSSGSVTDVTECDQYTWNGQTYTTSGLYFYTATNSSGCDSLAVLNLVVLQSNSSQQSVTSCDSYVWNGQTYTESGNYQYYTVNTAGCDSTANLSLTINPSYTSELTLTVCDTYSTPDGQQFTNSGVYPLLYTSVGGCDSLVTLNLTVNYSSYTEEIQYVCTQAETGPVVQQFTNQSGCDSTHVIMMTLLPANQMPQASFSVSPGTQLVLPNGTITLTNNSVNNAANLWSFGDGSGLISEFQPEYSFTEDGTYPVTLWVTNSFGCLDSMTVTVVVIENLQFEIPNVFTPNGDGSNDNFFLINFTGMKTIASFECTIVNRWGNTIRVFDAADFSWDGTTENGSLVNEGTYFYRIKLGTILGEEREFHGFVQLFR